MRRRLTVLRASTALLPLLLLAPSVLAQDIEVEAFVKGRSLPAAYFERILQRPDFFELRGGWIDQARGPAPVSPPWALPEATSPRASAATGSFPLLVVLALFSDSSTPTTAPGDIQARLFDGPNPAGTMTDYYETQSRGMFTVAGEVTPWVRTDLTASAVRAGSYGLGSDARTGEFLLEALERADEEIDLTAFDNDGPDGVPNSGDDDGFVDALAVEFLEAPLTCAGQGPTVWAHRSRVSGWVGQPFVSNDMGANGGPIRADDYIIQAAVACDGAPQSVIVIAHEFGHALGLPDLYDATEGILASQRNWVVGCWSVMAAGQWGCEPALSEGRYDRPPHFGPWEKEWLGWLPDLMTVDAGLDQEVVLRPVESSGDVLRLDLSENEYLLIEYRDGSGYDLNLPGTGILVHHIDRTRTTGNRRCRGCPQVYEAALIEADANRSLLLPEEQGGRRGEAGDIFQSGSVWELTNATTPSTRLNSGAPSDLSIYDMRVEEGLARVRFSNTVLDLEALLEPVTGGSQPASPIAEYLDARGNGDGIYDVGDLRAYLIEHPSVLAKGSGEGQGG